MSLLFQDLGPVQYCWRPLGVQNILVAVCEEEYPQGGFSEGKATPKNADSYKRGNTVLQQWNL